MRYIAFCSSVVLLMQNSFSADDKEQDFKKIRDQIYGEVCYSSVVFRHGQRTPMSFVYNDTDPRAADSFSEGFSQLTKLGKLQMYEVGKWYRQYYKEKISAGYRYDLLTMNSTSQDRALMSAEAFLAGMFPPLENETWADDGLQWQPIPVHTGNEDIIGVQDACDRYDMEQEKLNESPELKNLNSEFMDLFEYTLSHTKYYQEPSSTDVLDNIHKMWSCYNELEIEDSYNLTLPEWSKKVYPEPLESISTLYFILKANNTEMKRLKSGRLLGQIIDDMKKKRDGSLTQTFHVYSGHETMVAILLNTLGAFYHIPPESASILFELRMKNNEYVVTVSYKNSTTEPPHILKIEGCDEICTLDQFVEVMKPLIPDNWEAECQLGFFEKLLNTWKTWVTLVVLAWIVFKVITIGGTMLVCFLAARWKLRSNYNKVP